MQVRVWKSAHSVLLTVFGAKVPLRSGWNEVSETLRWLAARWSDCTDYRFDLVAADVSGDLAYLIGFEHVANSVVGVPVEPYTLRVTHIFGASRVCGGSLTDTPTVSRWTRHWRAK